MPIHITPLNLVSRSDSRSVQIINQYKSYNQMALRYFISISSVQLCFGFPDVKTNQRRRSFVIRYFWVLDGKMTYGTCCEDPSLNHQQHSWSPSLRDGFIPWVPLTCSKDASTQSLVVLLIVFSYYKILPILKYRHLELCISKNLNLSNIIWLI